MGMSQRVKVGMIIRGMHSPKILMKQGLLVGRAVGFKVGPGMGASVDGWSVGLGVG